MDDSIVWECNIFSNSNDENKLDGKLVIIEMVKKITRLKEKRKEKKKMHAKLSKTEQIVLMVFFVNVLE